jgi:hypothetical protein
MGNLNDLASDDPTPDPDRSEMELTTDLTAAEKEILKSALVKKAREETLTTVEEVIFREYEYKLQARELRRKAKGDSHPDSRFNSRSDQGFDLPG